MHFLSKPPMYNKSYKFSSSRKEEKYLTFDIADGRLLKVRTR